MTAKDIEEIIKELLELAESLRDVMEENEATWQRKHNKGKQE
jgi:hypothetical protein